MTTDRRRLDHIRAAELRRALADAPPAPSRRAKARPAVKTPRDHQAELFDRAPTHPTAGHEQGWY